MSVRGKLYFVGFEEKMSEQCGGSLANVVNPEESIIEKLERSEELKVILNREILQGNDELEGSTSRNLYFGWVQTLKPVPFDYKAPPLVDV